MANHEIKIFNKGIHNLLDAEIIPKEAGQDGQNWYSEDGRLKLILGRALVGSEGLVGNITGETFGYKVDGSQIHWRKAGTKIQYFDGTTWLDTVTGLTATADYSFTNYSSLAGTFTYAFGVDGIYKMHNAVPQSFCSMFSSAINYKGRAFIDKGRAILWNRMEDRTGLYGSWIDNKRTVTGASGVYTAVTAEATTSLTGTLAFKAGGATRNCFGVTITLTASGEVYTDAYLGTLSGSLGGTGTINYITGAYTLSNAGVGTANYQWEDSNLRGVTDFRKSALRLAGEGFQFPQDIGGDAILNVLVGQDGAYYSMKSNSTYKLDIASNDTDASNEIYRTQIGIPSYRSAVSSSKGIIFINTSTPEKPEMTILQKNITGDNIEPIVLFPQFKFVNYNYDDCTIFFYERYILVACKSVGSVNNDTILLCNVTENTVEIQRYQARTFASSLGLLYAGSPVSASVYSMFSGFDDDGSAIDNYYILKDEMYGSERLKKYRRIRLKGHISPNQSYEVYTNVDNQGFQLVGTVLGSGSYVDYTSPQSIGANLIGSAQIGGDDMTNIYPYFMEIRIKKQQKFRKRSVRFIAKGIGYVDIDYLMDWDISTYESKIPSAYRQKQNVSMSGLIENQALPEF